ncbi:hypothetical protein DCC85_11710 [Paenibacillus sp. CAA11]|nr:hypothetical protein DCC85_11710 [Paenibacillus sp. CAA11]
MSRFEDLKLEVHQVGQDMLFLLTGGKSHIGAATTAYLTDGVVHVHTSSVPGHKEYTLTAELARKAASALGTTVTVIMGIHYDHLGMDDIEEIAWRTAELMNGYLMN